MTAQADGEVPYTNSAWLGLIVVQLVVFVASAWLFVDSYDVTVPLFATWAVMVIHLAATLPLGIVVARYLLLVKFPEVLRWCGAILASLIFWVVAVSLSVIAQSIPLEYWVLGLARIVLCAAYHCVWVSCYPPQISDSIASGKQPFAPIALVVLILPAAYGLDELHRSTDTALSAMHSNRLVEAYRNALRLLQLDSSRQLEGVKVTVLARDLQNRILATEQQLTTTHSTPLPPSQVVMHLLSLSRIDEAELLLLKLPQHSPEVQILGILVARERRDWDQVRQRCVEYLKHPPDEMQATVFMSLAEAHGNLGEVSEAMEVYKQMIATLTSASDLAMAHFRLGLIHLENGDSAESWSRLNQAIALDPSLRSEVVRRQKRLQNFSCQLHATSPPITGN